jgi:hypothetical protein
MGRRVKVCIEAGCPELTTTTRCTTHTSANNKVQGTRQERGYGPAHQRTRAWWAPKVAAGTVKCWRCKKRISPLEPWDLGHDDLDRSIWRGPEHVLCNRGKRAISPDA